ncbi:hypothetical protein SCT_1290 [Sulfuricella sp. T08]|uniref:hypothetical protein n=1 Tax=Sulfuricella sp. T08 TaxID=1632857 RepID=UPI000617964B|nr:hypothetical protein [Sulfuricella sp. T08]GAO35894.1 hypothetical protein SCT_1290 [Sulfuricella sp. T08]
MTEKQAPERYKLSVRRIVFFTGIALILIGYGFLSVPPDAGPDVAEERAFKGLGLVVAGAALWLGSLLNS